MKMGELNFHPDGNGLAVTIYTQSRTCFNFGLDSHGASSFQEDVELDCCLST